MALDTNDLLVVSKNSDGSLAKVKVETLLESAGYIEEAPIDGKQYVRKDGAWTEAAITSTGDTAFVFMSTDVIQHGDDTSEVTANAVFIGRQPTSVAYQWVAWNSFNQTIADAVNLNGRFYRTLSGDMVPTSYDRVNCKTTATYTDNSTEEMYSGSAVEVFNPNPFP